MKKASDLLHGFFDKIQQSQGEAYIDFYKSWEQIAGPKIGRNTRINDISDGFLIIEIDHMGWKQLILSKENHIISQINRRFPQLEVKKIKFYFNNNRMSNVKEIDYDISNTPKDDKSFEEINIDNDFLQLLKKMSKRSEE